MSTPSTNNNATPQVPAGIPLSVLSQYIKDLSFENPGAPGLLSQLAATPPQVNVTVNVSHRALQASAEGQSPQNLPAVFECTLTVKAEGKLANQPAFMLECLYAAAVALPQNLPENMMRGLLMVETPRLLFPFVRQIVSDAVRDGGYGPLMVNPVDFMAMYQRQLQIEAEAATQQTGTA